MLDRGEFNRLQVLMKRLVVRLALHPGIDGFFYTVAAQVFVVCHSLTSFISFWICNFCKQQDDENQETLRSKQASTKSYHVVSQQKSLHRGDAVGDPLRGQRTGCVRSLLR